MQRVDRQFGFPDRDFQGTKEEIEALTGLTGGETAYATNYPSAPFGKFGTGTWHWSNNEIGGGTPFTGVDQIGIYGLDDGVPVGTGTWMDFGSNLTVSRSGTVLRVDASGGGGGGVDQIGFFGLDEGVPIGTGSYLNVTGGRAFLSRSGTMFNLDISPDAQELIGFYGLSGTTALGTGTSLSVGNGLLFSITGTTFYLSAHMGTGSSQVASGSHTHSDNLIWSTETSNITLVVGHGYNANGGTLQLMGLPPTSNVDDRIRVVGFNTGTYRVTQGAGQRIIYGDLSTTLGTGGYLQSNDQSDCVHLKCKVANTIWQVIDGVGNVTLE